MTRDEKYILIANKLREITFLISELQKEEYKQQEDRIKINSVWTRPKREHYVVVDFTTPLMYDDKKYMQHGMDLRDQFLEVPEWYHC